ncbi:MAG: hypothetical protein WD118_01345 [Phycisphaeraceae bacterium]
MQESQELQEKQKNVGVIPATPALSVFPAVLLRFHLPAARFNRSFEVDASLNSHA